jgi:hypothetical protein
MAVTIKVKANEQKILERLAQKIAEYWNGKTINVSVPGGAHWSDWESASTTTDEQGNTVSTGRKRVDGTYTQVTSIVGYISARAVGTNVVINIDYQITTTES